MGFAEDVSRFAVVVDRRARDVHNRVADGAYESVVNGSPLTGAPGQPVDTGNLRASWQNIVEGPLTRRIVTNTVYAPAIEDGARAGKALTLRSQVGGWHSVKLTIAAWRRLVEAVTREVAGA